MASSEQVAGHPIAIRVGGRRLSQSHPVRSPSKATRSTSPSTSPEDATNIPQPIPDYPRPRSPVVHTENDKEAGQGGGAEEGSTEQGNRKDRRRQERKKDKYKTEEDKMHGMQNGFPYDVKQANKEAKGSMGADKGKRQSSATGGMRITQPASKFMA